MADSRKLAVLAAGYFAATAIGGSSSLQGGINTSLARRLADGVVVDTRAVLLASLASFSTGVLCLLVLNTAHFTWQRRQGRPHGMSRPRSLWECCGGVLGSSVMALNLIALPITGFAVTSVMRSAGAIGCSLVLDQLGCVGTGQRALTRRRLAGAALLVAGASISVWHEVHLSGTVALMSAMPLISGTLLPLQAAVNGRLAKSLGAPLRATLVSFVGGFACLLLAVASSGVPSGATAALVGGLPCWMFAGGPLGVLFVTTNLLLPRAIGFGSAATFTTFGTLASSLVLDAIGGFGFLERPPTVLR
eukprot:5774568-Prymnesium_polylepis.1